MSDDIKTRKSTPDKFTNEDLMTMQKWDLDRKIATSLTRISEFYNHFPHKIFVLRPYFYQLTYTSTTSLAQPLS